MAKLILTLCFFAGCSLIHQTASHGRIEDPPNRGTLWRHAEYAWANPGHIADDTELHCGGESVRNLPASLLANQSIPTKFYLRLDNRSKPQRLRFLRRLGTRSKTSQA